MPEPTPPTDHANKLASSHGREHGRRYRLSLEFGAANDRQAHRLGMAWAGTAAAEWNTCNPIVTPMDGDLHTRLLAQLDAEPLYGLVEVVDAVVAALPELAELDRLRAEAEEGWRAKDAAEEERDVQRALADAFAETADNQRQRAEQAEGLLEIALHLHKHGDLAPGGSETWADWARTTETHLRAKEAPDVR